MQIGCGLVNMQFPIYLRMKIGQIPGRYNPFYDIHKLSNKSILKEFSLWNWDQRKQFVFHNIKQVVTNAYFNIPFYHDYYNRNDFNPERLKNFDDIKLIPEINKSILLESPIEYRSQLVNGATKVNTGGSSGKTLAFYRDPYKNYHEGLHITAIWESIGYKNSAVKLIMSGQNTVNNGIDFCFHSNSLRIDVYKEFSEIAPKLKKISARIPIKFLHGYPSLFYEFARFCDEFDTELRDLLRKSLTGAFLGSEYPHPRFREKIESVFNISSISWYGHTEGAVLAREINEKYRYFPFHTYGFAEVNQEGHLIGTSYYNRSAPFIRYDTEDIISDVLNEEGFINSFSIKDGRNGEFIIDKNGKKISLTGLIFGRHHQLFDHCSYLQVCQNEPGRVMILYTPYDQSITLQPERLFDKGNTEFEFSFRKMSYPIRTKSGKLNLLVKSEDIPDEL